MKNSIKACLIVVGMALYSGAVFGQQQKTDYGKQEFDAKCAVCHGTTGKGNGPLADFLRQRPSDLTQLTQKNGGVFPTTKVYEVIEGSNVPGHGTREMPVWGRDFQAEDAAQYKEARGHYDVSGAVRARILMLLEYINRLQAR